MWNDWLRDRALLQQHTIASDGAMGSTTSWTSLRSLPCRAGTVDSKSNDIYRREGFTNTVRLLFDDRITRTDGVSSLQELMQKEGENRHRLVFRGRILQPIKITRQSEAMHDYMPQITIVDCAETLEDVGYIDA